MRVALEEAAVASVNGEIPVGAIVVAGDRIVGRGHNRSIGLSDPTAHAEVMALRDAGARIGNYRLPETIMYVTLEPCPMCAGALVNARMERVVYGASDPKAGACRTLYEISDDPRLNHRCKITSGVLADECADLLSQFFKAKR